MAGEEVVTDAVVAGTAADGVEDAVRQSKRKKKKRFSAFQPDTPDDVCSNCSTRLTGPVCHSCGQTADTYHRPIWELVLEVVDGVFGLEGRIWRTLPPLLFQPGRLSRSYLSGVRARYVPPFRLYLVISVIFFLLFAAATGSFDFSSDLSEEQTEQLIEEIQQAEATREDVEQGLAQSGLPDTVQETILEGFDQGIEQGREAVVDAVEDGAVSGQAYNSDTMVLRIRQVLLPEDYPDVVEVGDDPDTAIVRLDDGTSFTISREPWMSYGMRVYLADQLEQIIRDNGESLWRAMQAWAPRLLFLLLPIYALMLAITHFYKRGYFFYDHLVVSLHFHAFIFAGLIGIILSSYIHMQGWAWMVFITWSNFYLYKLHRVVYRHGRFSSILRTLFMDFVYFIILLLATVVLMVIGLLLA